MDKTRGFRQSGKNSKSRWANILNGINKYGKPYKKYILGIPVFVAENTNVVYGVVNEPAEITVSIFSNPKYSDVIIKNKDGNRLLSNGIGMKLREQHIFVTDVIHTSRVRVKCYRTTFIITTLRSDMVQNYTVFVLNDYGSNRFQTSVLFASKFLELVYMMFFCPLL